MLILNFLYFLWGLIFGSFINVLRFRLPNNQSIIKPRSFCPDCKYSIPFYRNIPVASYILQLGKCSNCNCKISILYPIIEISTGLIWLFSSFYFNSLKKNIFLERILFVKQQEMWINSECKKNKKWIWWLMKFILILTLFTMGNTIYSQ